MKICIVSDSHDCSEPLAAAVTAALAAGAKAVNHCGDVIGAHTLRASLKLGLPIHVVQCGNQVISGHLIEKSPTLGGRTSLLYRYFPKLCRSTCGLEINLRRLKDNRNERVMTMTEMASITGTRGKYEVKLNVTPRFVTENCTGCSALAFS